VRLTVDKMECFSKQYVTSWAEEHFGTLGIALDCISLG
jgi:hypothetical protein